MKINNIMTPVVLGGVMVIAITTEPKVRGFKHGGKRWILKAIKIRSTTSFGGE
jgi:hypothetical protein